jgi:hypothetical protein
LTQRADESRAVTFDERIESAKYQGNYSHRQYALNLLTRRH